MGSNSLHNQTTADPKIFRAYDIRGVYPLELDEGTAYSAAQAFAKFAGAKKVALGYDDRPSSPALFEAARKGLQDHGVSVVDIGRVTADMLYFAVAAQGYDGGVIISASHNPENWNGLKLVGKSAVPLSMENGLDEIRDMVLSGYSFAAQEKGAYSALDIASEYFAKCLSLIDTAKIKPLKVKVRDWGGVVVRDLISEQLPIEFCESGADLEVSWDADADRFFIWDENGRAIPPYYVSAALSDDFTKKTPGAAIVHDLRLVRAIEQAARANGGKNVVIKAGRVYFNPEMRKHGAVFGSETSGHFYFKDFFYADNGLIPFLLILELLSRKGQRVSEIFDPYFEAYPISGEINFPLESSGRAQPILRKIAEKYSDAKIDWLDGITIEYPLWRANVRASNTEPLLRLNLEAASALLVEEKTREILEILA